MKKKNLILFFVLLFFANKSHPNKVSTEMVNLYRDPTTGGTLSVGKIFEDKNGLKYFAGKKGWTNYPLSYFIRPTITRSQDDLLNYRYVGEICFLYAKEKTDQSGELVKNSHYSVISITSDEAKKLITTLADRQEFVGEINPSWQFCESDNECMLTKNKCGSLTGVNKKYEKHYLDFLKTNKLKLDCSKESAKTKTAESKCVENFCS